MATENEEILKAHIEELQTSMMQMTGYLNELVQVVNQNQNVGVNYSHQFYSQDRVDVYLPFHVSPTSLVTVMVEETPGQYRQVMPMISINGQNVTVNFDRHQSGYVIVDNDAGCAMNINPPPNFVSMGSVSLYEPVLEPPMMDPVPVSDETKTLEWTAGFTPQPITSYTPTPTEVQPMTPKTPVGSEDVSKDRAFAKAMGDITPWP